MSGFWIGGHSWNERVCSASGDERGKRDGMVGKGRKAGKKQAHTDRHREVERRLPGSRVSVREDDRVPDEELPHSMFGVRLLRRRFSSASLFFLVGLLGLLELPRDVLREVDCVRVCDDDERGSGMTSTRPPLGGMIT